jgi:hypothetical protein
VERDAEVDCRQRRIVVDGDVVVVDNFSAAIDVRSRCRNEAMQVVLSERKKKKCSK